jgi:hypothetical protein
VVEQACISLVSALIKMRGSRSLVLPQTAAAATAPGKQAAMQSGGQKDIELATNLLKPFDVPYLRST